MTKAELIAALAPFPDDLTVVISSLFHNDTYDLKSVFYENDGVIYLELVPGYEWTKESGHEVM